MFLRSHVKCMEGNFCSLFAVQIVIWAIKTGISRGCFVFWEGFKITPILQVIQEENSVLFSARTEDYLSFTKWYCTLKVLGPFIPGRLDFHIQSILLRFCSKCSTFLILKRNSMWIPNKIFAFALIFSCYSYLLKFYKYMLKVFIFNINIWKA